jgi:hypothetical protein
MIPITLLICSDSVVVVVVVVVGGGGGCGGGSIIIYAIGNCSKVSLLSQHVWVCRNESMHLFAFENAPSVVSYQRSSRSFLLYSKLIAFFPLNATIDRLFDWYLESNHCSSLGGGIPIRSTYIGICIPCGAWKNSARKLTYQT